MISFNPHVLVVPAKHQQAGAVIVKRKSTEARESSCEVRIDEVVEQSFPASDPPSWNMGVADPDAWR